MNVLRLRPEHADQLMRIRQGNPTDIDGAPLANPMYARHYLENQYLVPENEMYRTWGLVDSEGRIWCYLLQKLMTSQRAWLLLLVISDQTASNGLPMNGLGILLDAAIEYAESKRYYRYFTYTPAARAEQHDRVWDRVARRKTGRYVSALEEQLPPRTVSAFSFYWDEVMGTAMFDQEMAIRHVFLLPEHRK